MDDPQGFGTRQAHTFEHFKNITSMVKSIQPTNPVHCWHIHETKPNVDAFINHFPGTPFVAIKANPEPKLLQYLYDNGIRSFDVASLNEVKLARGMFPDARLAFMNPIKNREAIRTAYNHYGVRDFSLDTIDELTKILDETNNATDLGLHVRLAVPKGQSAYDVSGNKFGAPREVAIELLQKIKATGNRVGICFHAGSQIANPSSYQMAIEYSGKLLQDANVAPDVFDVGGGFPVVYCEKNPIPLEEFFSVISICLKALNLPSTCEIWCEPGRAVTAGSQSLVVQVQLRKGDWLHINDGVYGSLFEADTINKQSYPVELIRLDKTQRKPSKKLIPFSFYGPTCDSVDRMPGPFLLPEDTREGDWVVIHMHGAYGTCSQSTFNGFYSDTHVEIGPKLANDNRGKNVISMNPRRKVAGKPARSPKVKK